MLLSLFLAVYSSDNEKSYVNLTPKILPKITKGNEHTDENESNVII